MRKMEEAVGFETTKVEASCGRSVKCSYLEHPNFDRKQNIWQSMHYIFLQYSPTVKHANVYALRSSINSLLDYVFEYNEANPVALHVTHFIDISTEVFNGFVTYLRKNKISVSYADKLKSALTMVSKNTGKLPLLHLPSVKIKTEESPTEPLTDQAYEQLVDALKTHIGVLRAKLEFRKEIDNAAPYDFEKVMGEIFPSRDRSHVYQWYQYTLAQKLDPKRESFELKFKASGDKELIELCGSRNLRQTFTDMYERESAPFLLKNPINPFERSTKGVSYWIPDTTRTLKTLLTYNYPFALSLEEIETGYSRQALKGVDDCDNIVKLLLHKYTWGARLIKCAIPSFDDIMAMYYPTALDMAALIAFMMLQSGWNKETVLAIDRENFEHALTGAISESMRMVFSEKNKSQALNKPYSEPKEIAANSDKNNPYSLYNLIVLADELSAPLRGIQFDAPPSLGKGIDANELFLCFRPWGEWQGFGGRHTSLSNPKAYQTAVKAFLEMYPIYEDGRRLAVAGDLGRRLRPTWTKHQRKTSPLSVLALQMGHESQETTDVHYDSSGTAMQERRVRLRSALEEVMELLRTRQFQGLLGEHASVIANAKPRFFHIPGKDRPIWGCRNQRKPSWPGANRQITTGTKCTAIDKCLGCEQVWITEDSLPYLFERLQHLEEDLDERDDSTYSERLEAEKEIIEYLIDSWQDDDAIRLAERYQRKNSPLLPRDLASMRLIFMEDDVQELPEEITQISHKESINEPA